jgi:ADP-heptose:LPS heptosyltransferase
MKSILLIRPDRIGDALLTLPAVRALRHACPDSRLTLAAHDSLSPLLGGGTIAHTFVPSSTIPRTLDGAAAWMRERRDDAVVFFHPDPVLENAAARAALPLRVGWKTTHHTLTHPVEDIRATSGLHESQLVFLVLSPFGLHPPQEPPTPCLDPLRPIDTIPLPASVPHPDRTAVFHITSAREVRQWPPDRFAHLARRLAEQTGLSILLSGSDPDHPAHRIFLNTCGSLPVTDLTGQLPLDTLAALLTRSALFISCDTGPAHLAAAVGCPQITLFGRTDPGLGPDRWAPLNPKGRCVTTPIHRRFWETRRMFWRRGFRSLTVDTVLAATLALLSNVDEAPWHTHRDSP